MLVVALTLCSAAVLVRGAGWAAGSAAAALRGPGETRPASPEGSATAAPTGPAPTQGAPAVNAQLPPGQPTPEPATQPPLEPSPTSAPPPTPLPAAQPTPRPAPTAPQRREHTVAAGDTLSAIAQRYGTTVDALVAANNLPSRSATLRIGQRLIIPG